MGFTGAKEAGDPDADVLRRLAQRFLVDPEKCLEVFIQFVGDDVFIELLFHVAFVLVADFDDAFQVSCYAFGKEFFYVHAFHLSYGTSLKAR